VPSATPGHAPLFLSATRSRLPKELERPLVGIILGAESRLTSLSPGLHADLKRDAILSGTVAGERFGPRRRPPPSNRNMESMRLTTSLVLLALAGPAVAQTARPSTQVDTTTPPRSFQGGAATYGGRAAVAWKDSAQGIHAAYSDDAGVTWNASAQVDKDGGIGTSKFIAFGTAETIQVNGDHVYVIWEDVRDGVTNEIYFNRSIDAGQTFESGDQAVSESANMGYVWTLDQAMALVRASDPADDQIHVVYTVEDGFTVSCDAGDPTAGPEDIYYNNSIDGGASFGSSVLLTSASGTGADIDDIAICAAGDNVYVAWIDNRDGCFNDVYFVTSDDQGGSWTTEIALETTGAGNASRLTMDCDGPNVVVGWQEEPGVGSGPETARLAVSTDAGQSFGADRLVGDYVPLTDDVDDYKLAYSLGNIVYALVYDDIAAGGSNNQVYVSSSSDNGVTFATDTALTVTGGSFPRITEGGAEVAVSWNGSAFPNAVEGSYSLDGGVSWSSIVTVNDTPLSDTDFVEVAYDPIKKNVVVAWLDDQDNGAGVFDNNNNVQLAGGYSIGGQASATFRNGGANPASYTASGPIIGGNFAGALDVGSTGHSLGVIVGYATPFTFTFSGRTLLVNIADPGGELLALPLSPGPIANFLLVVPNDPCFAGLTVSSQGIHVGGPPYLLSNAQDLVVGAF
jgi:hypothetical protein